MIKLDIGCGGRGTIGTVAGQNEGRMSKCYLLLVFYTEQEQVHFPLPGRNYRLPNTTYTHGLSFADKDPWKLKLIEFPGEEKELWMNHVGQKFSEIRSAYFADSSAFSKRNFTQIFGNQ